MEIRPAHTQDVPALARLISALSQHHGDVSPITDMFLHDHAFGAQPFGHFKVAEEQGIIIGFVMHACQVDYSFARLHMIVHLLHVDAPYRGKGIGRRLMAHAIVHGLQQGCSSFRITGEKRNPDTLAVYRRFGFQEDVGETSIRFTADKALMEKIVTETRL